MEFFKWMLLVVATLDGLIEKLLRLLVLLRMIRSVYVSPVGRSGTILLLVGIA